MQVPIVNDKDEIIGHKERDALTPEDIVRASGVWIVNSRNEVLLMQRAADKSFFPLKWGVSASGMVDEGESYVDNAIKEAREELGIVLREDELIRGERRFMQTKFIPYFYQTFFARRDIPIEDLVFQPHEVEDARWMSVPDIAKWFSERPDDFFPTFERGLKNIEGFVKSQEAA